MWASSWSPVKGRTTSPPSKIVAAAARHNLDVLPVVLYYATMGSPAAPQDDNYYLYAPRNPGFYADFLRVLVGRYGPRGYVLGRLRHT